MTRFFWTAPVYFAKYYTRKQNKSIMYIETKISLICELIYRYKVSIIISQFFVC